MSAARFVLGLVGGLFCLTSLGCYAHHPWGPYGNSGYAPLYSTPGTYAVPPTMTTPGATYSPGVDSLGQPGSLNGGQSDGFQQPVPYDDDGTFYDGGTYNGSSSGSGASSRSSGPVPDYRDLNDPAGVSSSGAGGTSPDSFEYGVTPFGQNR